MIVIAHRGSSQSRPENTLPAIKKAIQDQADAIEIDVQLTSDQQVVVIHDEWLGRTTNGWGFVHDTPSSVITELDAGQWFDSKFKGTKVPTLEDVLAFMQSYHHPLVIELKNNLIPYEGLERKVIELVRQYDMSDRVILSSFRLDSLATCMRIAPDIRRAYLCWNSIELFEVQLWERVQPYAIHPHISMIFSGLHWIQRQGIRIFPYVVQTKKQLQQCIQQEVDGFFTNAPRKAVKKQGL